MIPKHSCSMVAFSLVPSWPAANLFIQNSGVSLHVTKLCLMSNGRLHIHQAMPLEDAAMTLWLIKRASITMIGNIFILDSILAVQWRERAVAIISYYTHDKLYGFPKPKLLLPTSSILLGSGNLLRNVCIPFISHTLSNIKFSFLIQHWNLRTLLFHFLSFLHLPITTGLFLHILFLTLDFFVTLGHSIKRTVTHLPSSSLIMFTLRSS